MAQMKTLTINGKMFEIVDDEAREGVQSLETKIPSSALPNVTANDAGKFLRVDLNGKWVAEDIPSAEGENF